MTRWWFGGTWLLTRTASAQLFDVVTDVDKYSHFVPFCVCVPASQPSALSAALTQTAHALPPSSASRVTRRLTPRAFEAELAVGFQLLRRVDQPLLAASLTLRSHHILQRKLPFSGACGRHWGAPHTRGTLTRPLVAFR